MKTLRQAQSEWLKNNLRRQRYLEDNNAVYY